MARTTRFPTSLGLALVACAALGLAAPWQARAQPLVQEHGAQEQAEEHEEGPLGQAMEHMKAALRRLGRAVQGDDAAVALPLVAEFQANVIAAKSQVPHTAEELAGAEKERFLGEFRSTMVKLLRVTCDLEMALIESRMDDARRILEDELKAMQEPAHDRFRGDEEH